MHLLGGRADGTYERRLLTDTRPDVVILDDFRLKPLPAAGPEDFDEVINERYERGALINTSNHAFTEWPDLFQSPLLFGPADVEAFFARWSQRLPSPMCPTNARPGTTIASPYPNSKSVSPKVFDRPVQSVEKVSR